MLWISVYILSAFSVVMLSSPTGDACISPDQFTCDNQKCIQVSFRCDGDDDCGDYSDENYCTQEPLPDKEFVVLVGVKEKNLFQLDPDTGNIRPLLPVRSPNLVAVAIDLETKYIYYTDVQLAVIGRIDVDAFGSRAMKIIHQDNTGGAVLDGLAIDSTRRKLYYCNAGVPGSLGELNTDGSQHRVLLLKRGIKPRGLAIDTQTRLLYWTNWGDSPSIEMLNVVTGYERKLVDSGLKLPNSIVLDPIERILIWADAGTHKLEAARLDGADRRAIYIGTDQHYFDLAISPTNIYISDWNKNYIRKVDRDTLVMYVQEPISFYRVNGLAVYYPPSNITAPLKKVFKELDWRIEL